MNNQLMFSSKTDLWSTPLWFFNKYNKIYDFTLDPCAVPENAKCKKFFTREDSGLMQDWNGERVFMNPPYGREIKHWIKKASYIENGLAFCLLPARTDTIYFHDYIYKKDNVELEFLKGRLKFGKAENSAPFGSMIVIFRG